MPAEASYAKRSRILARTLLAVAAFVMLSVLFGWWFDIAALRSVELRWAYVTFNTAVCALLLTLAAWCTSFCGRLSELGRIVFASTALLISALTLSQNWLNVDFGIDQLLFTVPDHLNAKLETPGRMAMATALSLSCLGIALLLINRWRQIAQALTLASLLVAFVAITGYLFHVESLYQVFMFSSVAAQTAVTLALLSGAIFLLRPKPGFVMVMFSQSTGGTLARLLVPAFPLVQIILATAALAGFRRGYYSVEMAIALVAISGTVTAVIIIWQISMLLFKIDNQRNKAEEKAQRLARTDDLTGLHNRRGFFMFAEHELAVANRSNSELSLFYIDVDGLKRVNDKRGHEAGDLLICRTAAILQNTFRKTDILARIGGDEFAVVTRDDANPEVIVDRLYQRIATANESSPDLPKLAVSIGAVRCNSADYREQALARCLAAADEKMYLHKQSKRHRHAPVAAASSAAIDRSPAYASPQPS